MRVTTEYTAFDQPVRVVFGGAHTWFAASQTELLGFDHLSKVGVGLELGRDAPG